MADDDGSKWEFQAPQFVDFTKLDEDQGADSFFDVDMESGSRVSQMFVDGGGKISEEFRPAAAAAHMETVEEAAEPAAADQPPKRVPKPSNMVRSWGAGKNIIKSAVTGVGMKSSDNSKPKAKEPAIKTRSSAENGKPKLAESPVKRAMRQETPTRRSLRAAVSETINNVRNSPHLKRLGTNTDAPRFNSQADKNLSSASAARHRTRSKSPGHALSKPRTPDVMRRFKNKLAENAANKDLSEFKVKKSSQAVKEPQPVKPPVIKAAAATLTRPAEFKFATAARTKESRRRSMSVSDAPDFSRMLRSYSKAQPSAAGVSRELTKPVPFPRAESRKRRLSDDQTVVDRFKSMAEQVSKFQKGTPDRFHSKPRGRSGSPVRTRLRSQSPRGLTIAVTPQLSTRGRSRPNAHVLSQAEREQQELEEAQRHQFRAKKVGEGVPKFQHGEVERRPCTVPEPFNLAGVSSRPFAKPQTPEVPAANFKSNPLNRKILEKPTGVPEKRIQPIIEPESPAFALKKRMAMRAPAAEPKEEPERIVKAKPVPHYGVPVAMSLPNKRTTVPQPFSFAERDVMSAAAKEERIRKLLEEEKAAHEFHAQPIPKGVEHPRLPEKKALQPTVPAPFKMNIEERLESRINKWQEDMNKELEEQKRAANFKASEPKVLSQAPFVPKPAEKHLTEISNFNLHTDRRAEERREYEIDKKKKEVDLEAAKRQRDQRREREEEEEVQKLRKQQVHKAQPIRGYKPVEIKPSEKPLTLPMSPRLTSRSSRANSTFNRTGASSKSQ